MIKIDSNRLRSETKPNITSAISNLNQASSLLKEIKIPDNFCYLSDLKVIPSQIDQIVTDVKGINTYIDQKTAEFDAVRNARVPIGIGVRANVLNYEYNLTTAKKTGASATNLFISFVKGIADFGESLIDTAAVVTSIPLTVLTAGQDIAQSLKSGKGLWDIDFKNTKNLWSGTMSMVAEDTVGNAFSKFYEKTKVGNWLDTNAYTPFKSGRGVAKVAEGIGQIAGVVAFTVLTCGAGTGAVGAATAAKAAATKATVSSAIAGARGFGEGAEYLWGKQRDSSWAGLQRIHKRGEISNETIELYKNIRNMSEKEIYKLYRSGKATKEEYNTMLQINRMPEDWITTKNATSGLLYGAATGGWEALQYYTGNKLNNFSIKGVSALANAATRVGIDTGFNAADTPFRAGVESILTRKNFKKLFDEQGGLNAVLVSAGVGAIGSIGGEFFGSYKAKKIEKMKEELNLRANKTVAEYLVNYKNDEIHWERYKAGDNSADREAIKEYLKYYIDGEKGFEKYLSENGINCLKVNDKLSVAQALGDSKLYLIESAKDQLNNGDLTATQNKELKVLLNRYANTSTCELNTEQILKELSPYLGKKQIKTAKKMLEVGTIELITRGYSKEQLKSVDEYTFTASLINTYLDNPTLDYIEKDQKDMYMKVTKNMDEIIDSAHYDDVIIGYRAVEGIFDNSGNTLNIRDMEPGDSFSVNRFQSASILYENNTFAKKLERMIIIKEYISPNSGAAAYIDNIAGQKCYRQMEIVTGRNKTMTLIDYPYPEKDIFGLPKIVIPVWVQ